MTPPWIAERWIEDPETGCWIWQLSKTDMGYGRERIGTKLRAAHHGPWIERNGPIPEGLVLDHLCRTPSCVNPDHLEAVTNAENTRRGLLAKLNREQAEEIRSSEEHVRVLMERFGVSRSTVYMIRQGRRWAAL